MQVISMWDIYWLTRLDGIRDIFGITLIVIISIGIGVLCGAPFLIDSWDKVKKSFKRWAIIGGTISFICMLALIFIPTTKEFAAIWLIPKIANNEQIQKIPNNAVLLLNKKMEQWIDAQLAEKPKEEKKNG